MVDELSRIFAALADPTRRDMVTRLSAGDSTVNELADPYPISLQAVYKHLKVLEKRRSGDTAAGAPAPARSTRSGGL